MSDENKDDWQETPETIKAQMNLAMRMLTELFPGKNITFFMAEFGDSNPERRMYYASNGQRQDMMKVLQEYIDMDKRRHEP